ncbi:MAG: bifunctional 4-hydroxy-2-oxoglutarate aldolase/2-dehydro-3-deoxy-phosphogluconate aldolase [Acidobacteriota bacterium]|nr:bifunctional 4-hydroxy-2-oxoglutarate aldolase/2-dehydro-3-deoxy-phosphogluconate aldolase [Acidobacteriota bacterium]
MTRDQVFARIKEIGIIPAIRPSDSKEAIHAVAAICRGGIPVVEISMAMPSALNAIEEVLRNHGAEVLVGAGTAIDAESVRLACLSGAQFIVSSGFNADTVRVAHEFDVPIFAGALTPTEVQLAWASDADAVKLYPCYAVGGPRYLKSLRGQYPTADFIASGGVNLENCSEYLRAGACAIGVGGEIGDAGSMAAGDHRLFTERAKRFRKAVCEAKALWRNGRSH